uniref:Uncharacterized protein n=1 Tax=Vitis vinifera TaxID=29760 RepID=A5AW10_VITVI|nr:hypothetical protein VITISV_014007 [Vitis vinifera]
MKNRSFEVLCHKQIRNTTPLCDAQHNSFHPDGNSHSFHPDVSHPEFCPANVLPYPNVSLPQFCPADILPSPDISQPDGRGGRFNFSGQTCPDPLIEYFTSGYLTTGWERRTFQLPRLDMSGSSNSAYPKSFSLNIQCHGVLPKLPDISDRLLEIFFFRYLMSKSPNSPCNPPIIGFLSL